MSFDQKLLRFEAIVGVSQRFRRIAFTDENSIAGNHGGLAHNRDLSAGYSLELVLQFIRG